MPRSSYLTDGQPPRAHYHEDDASGSESDEGSHTGMLGSHGLISSALLHGHGPPSSIFIHAMNLGLSISSAGILAQGFGVSNSQSLHAPIKPSEMNSVLIRNTVPVAAATERVEEPVEAVDSSSDSQFGNVDGSDSGSDDDEQLPAFLAAVEAEREAKRVAAREATSKIDRCVICLADFEPGDQLAMPFCLHKFHPDCISSWLQRKPNCPVCNQNVRKLSRDSEQQQQNQPSRSSPAAASPATPAASAGRSTGHARISRPPAGPAPLRVARPTRAAAAAATEAIRNAPAQSAGRKRRRSIDTSVAATSAPAGAASAGAQSLDSVVDLTGGASQDMVGETPHTAMPDSVIDLCDSDGSDED